MHFASSGTPKPKIMSKLKYMNTGYKQKKMFEIMSILVQ